MRKVILALFVGIGFVVILMLAGQWYIRRSRPAVSGTFRVDGIAGPVEIWRDSAGVPHIWAERERDLYFAQGYVHAQDRLWQLELYRRLAEGRLAEIMGDALIDTDRFLRTVGIWRATAVQEETLDAGTRALLDAYAAGINTYIARAGAKLPPEFLLLRIRPEPWTLRHTLAIEKIMAWDLTTYNASASLQRAMRAAGPDRTEFMQSIYPEWGADIIEAPIVERIPAVAESLLDAASSVRASNAWVIGGSRTASGRPILANDMHLALRAPSLWYLAALHSADGRDVAGMSLPGAPAIIAGHNRAVAWGFTNAMLDDLDLIIERIDPADSLRYITPIGTQQFEIIRDSITVRDSDSAVVFDIRLSRNGPIVARDDQAGTVIAMRWAGHDPSTAFTGLRRMNAAGSAAEFREAIPLFDNPHQNVVYADSAGEFGYVMAGRIPDRGGRPAPLLPVPGWTGEWDWRGYLPTSTHPAVANPPGGYVVTANNRQTADPIADLIGNDWAPPFRAMRIVEMARQSRAATADTVHAMQLDIVDLLATRYKPLASEAAASAGSPEAASLLRAWDSRALADSHAAAWFYVWYEGMREHIARDLYHGATAYLPPNRLHEILDRRALPWRAAEGRVAFDSILTLAARQANSIARGRKWGDLHSVAAEHPLTGVPALQAIFRFNVGPVPHGGAPNTVNVSHYFTDRWPVVATYGPSQRHVVDMADVDGAGGFILPTGQSGLPFHPHYRDQWPMWLKGGLWRIPLDRDAAARRAVSRMQLVPSAVVDPHEQQ